MNKLPTSPAPVSLTTSLPSRSVPPGGNLHRRFLLAAVGWLVAVSAGFSQSLYFVNKIQNFTQTSGAGAVVDANNPFSYSLQMATNGTFTVPGGGTLTLASVASNADFEANQSFATKAALDAAFPNGTYTMTGTGIPTLSFNMAPDTYPANTPQVTNGTWSSGGLLVVDPAVDTTINFSSYSDYATAGVLGHFEFNLETLLSNVDPNLKANVASKAVFGLTQQATAPTSFTIPAGSLVPGAIYGAGLDFDTGTTVDTTSISGGGVVGLFSKKLVFFIVAQASGTTLPAPPVITLQPINRTGATGGSATLAFSATMPGTATSVLWWGNGQQLDLGDQTKYDFFLNTNGSSLTIKNLSATDAGTYYAQLITAGGVVATVPVTLTVAAAAPPSVPIQSTGAAVASGGTATFTATASGTSPTYQWKLNGTNLSGATNPVLSLANVQPSDAGLYTVVATTGTGSTPNTTILGVSTTSKVIGAGSEIASNISAPNKNVYDQVLLSGAAAAITADSSLNQITRTSFIDLTDDIVQVEFGGAGTISMVLDNPTGPAAPINYNQPSVSYMKGHVGLVITGANETTNLSVFSVGRFTANDPTGTFNPALPVSATNDPAKNGSPLFVGHDATVYDGLADLAFIAISSTNGKFGGLRASNASFYAAKGLTGVYAPGVQFTGPVFVGDINASNSATPVLIIGSSGDTRITGGDLFQTNGAPVKVFGLTQLKFTDGTTSGNVLLPAQHNLAHLDQSGLDVTVKIVSNPP